MCMPSPTVEQFVEAVKATVLANKRWVKYYLNLSISCLLMIGSTCQIGKYLMSHFQVPPPGKGSLYIRPLLMGSGAVLGLAPAPEYTFLIYVSPVGNYFKVCNL